MVSAYFSITLTGDVGPQNVGDYEKRNKTNSGYFNHIQEDTLSDCM